MYNCITLIFSSFFFFFFTSESSSDIDTESHPHTISSTKRKNSSGNPKMPFPQVCAPNMKGMVHIPTSLLSEMSSKQIHDISASKLNAGNMYNSGNVSSFSRGLSAAPVEVLQRYSFQRKQRLVHDKETGRIAEDSKQSDVYKSPTDPPSLPRLSHQLCTSLGVVQATDHMMGHSHMHHYDKHHSEPKDPSVTHTDNRTPSDGIRTPIPDILPNRRESNIPAHPVTVKLDLDNSSARSKSCSSRFMQLPRVQALAGASLQSTKERRLSDAKIFPFLETHSIIKTPKIYHVTSESPDYMTVGADFAAGQLILQDKEGIVAQHYTESDSEISSEPCPSSEDKTMPSGFNGEESNPGSRDPPANEPGVSVEVDMAQYEDTRVPPTTAMKVIECSQLDDNLVEHCVPTERTRLLSTTANDIKEMNLLEIGITERCSGIDLQLLPEGTRAPPTSAVQEWR